MATISLPEQPSIEQLRTQARELQRAIRSGDPQALQRAGLAAAAPGFGLTRAQLLTARGYGFPSWARLRRHVTALSARTWVASAPPEDEPPADRFLRLAVLAYDGGDGPGRWAAAAQLRVERPDLPASGLAVAAVCADVDEVGRYLAADRGAANRAVAPYGWPPLLYLAFARLDVDRDALLATAGLLLDAGADPNDGRFFGGLPTPFTVLTGVFGGGEGGQPPHPHAIALARLLLSRGAEPNDGQALYNRMFEPADDFLELLFEFGLGQGDGGPWRRLLPDALPAPAELLRGLLDWAVLHDQRARVERLAAHGVDVRVPLPGGRAPIDVAVRNGHAELAESLRRLGARAAELDPVDAFVAAALAGDAEAVAGTPAAVVAAARAARPALLVWAAGQDRLDAVELLAGAGFDLDALGRADVPVEQPWQTALHTAVERGNLGIARRLLELGADPAIHDARFDGTPLDWAGHLDRPEIATLFRPSGEGEGEGEQRLRPAGVDDLAMITAGEQAYMHEIEPDHEAEWLAALDRNRALWIDNLDRTVVLEIDGAPAGYVMWAVDGPVATVITIHVVPEFRRRGLGAVLFDRFVNDAVAGRATELRLGVHRDNPARQLYESAGFVHTGDDGEYLLYERTITR